MKHAAFVVIMGLMPVALTAEEVAPSPLERGAELFFEHLFEEFDPALRQLQDLTDGLEPGLRSFADEMGPVLRDLMTQIEDWSAYHPPEILENGDIILRRKEPETRPEPQPPVVDAIDI
ncbi:hypothetical protein [Primorskyibacter sp. S187A]|uniref:hypothetical protein n=1 Tax=Primorskyibacter sp. S187A TaxID=3415130 RepID=UPI003C7D1C30